MNYIKQVAEMLGLEIGEVFALTCWKCYFRFTETQLEMKDRVWSKASAEFLEDMICRKQEIIKMKWEPSRLGNYWTYYGESFDVGDAVWEGNAADYARLKSGMVFRSKEKAVAERERVYRSLTGKKWGDQS